MEVREGYKKTEVGVIPEEWDVRTLDYCLVEKPSYGINAAAVPYDSNLPTYIRITDISDEGRFIKENRVSVLCDDADKYQLKDTDIVFARTGASTGKSYLYNPKDGPLVFAGFLIRTRINVKHAAPRYIKACVETSSFWEWVKKTSTRSGQPGINGNEYASYVIPIPPLPEQQAIATALSDIDGLISSLKKLIDKKKNIKQGAMQELITGKKRLDGFSGDWVEAELSNYLKFQVGFPFTSNHFNQNRNGIRLIKNRDLKSNDQVFYYSGEYIEDYIVTNGDVLVGMDGDFIPCLWNKGKALLNQRVGRLIVGNNLDLLFIRYALIKPLEDIQRSTFATTVKHLSHNDIEKMILNLPLTIEEQTAIANILSDMDNEIEVLEQKLNKYKAIKQGMMQELLTGRIRLVEGVGQ